MTDSNIFLTDPLRIVILDPIKNINMHTYIMLGDVSRACVNACEHYHTATAGQRADYDRTLRAQYGPGYKCKLGLDVKDPSTAFIRREFSNEISGEILGGADYDMSDIEELLMAKHEGKDITVKKPHARAHVRTLNFESMIEYITDIQVFPEDKISELKDKIQLVSDIPTYRQHLFYISGDNRVIVPYNLYADGIYAIDIMSRTQGGHTVFGLAIDKTLYDARERVRVEALDTFNILARVHTRTIYIVDLALYTRPIQTQLYDISTDTYQFELLYYGFIIKYWPQLTQECFHDYVIDETEMQYKYPDLAKNKGAMTQIYRAEKEIATQNYRQHVRASAYARDNISLAITQMVATVTTPRVTMNIRNLFDRLRCTKCVPEIHAYVSHNNKTYMLRKRHIKNGSDIQFPSGTLMKNGVTIAISLRKSDQETYHAKSTISTLGNEQSRYLFLNIWPTGKYYVKTLWNEEDEHDFDDILRIMKKFTDPILTAINGMGKYVFVHGASLALMTKQNVSYMSIGAAIFWKKVVLEPVFRAVRSLWEQYMRARIIGPRNVQQFDKYEFLFRKGMYEFDIGAIDKIITASNNIILSNYYAYLSNNAVKQKWDQNYDGRIVRMSHRMTDIRFEILDAKIDEFKIFYDYMVGFIYAAAGNERVKEALHTVTKHDVNNKLKKLREEDPELYNLKKHGSKKVYSIVCQNRRQPLIYTADEIRQMPAADIKKLTQYWNFTLNKPAYYGCPNKLYPHFSYMVGAHPKHYCLPCCSKKPTVQDSKRTHVNAICQQKHKYIAEESGEISRHVMGYGKSIEPGRLSKLPQSSIKNLLFNTIADAGVGVGSSMSTVDYFLYGCAQHVPAVEHIGIIYAVAEAMDTPMETLMADVIKGLRARKEVFGTLLNGTLIEYFSSVDDLCESIHAIFVRASIVSKELQKFKQWPEIFTEIFHEIMDISIFTFIDASGDGRAIELFVPDTMRDEITHINKTGATVGMSHTYIMLVKKQNQVYPIFTVDTNVYFKTFEVHTRTYTQSHAPIKLLFNMVKYASDDDNSMNKRIDLIFIKSFVAAGKYKLKIKYVNKQNLCYAVLLELSGKTIYCPIEYSVYISDGIPISFDAYDQALYADAVSYESLMQFFSDVNEHIASNYSIGDSTLYIYMQLGAGVGAGVSAGVSAEVDIVPWRYDEKYGGVMCSGLMFYCTGVPARAHTQLNYNPTDVNKQILARAAPASDARVEKIGEALYSNYLYQLIVVEFINYMNNERNDDMRKRISQMIHDTNFRRDIVEFRRNLKALLVESAADYSLISAQVNSFYTSQDKAELLRAVDSTIYDFDHITMNRLKKLSAEDMVQELRKIAAKIYVEQPDFDATGVKFPNVYMPCVDLHSETGYCAGNKLIVNRPLDTFIDILAQDLGNDLKSAYLLGGVWLDIVTDWLKFTKWPTEIITIYKLAE